MVYYFQRVFEIIEMENQRLLRFRERKGVVDRREGPRSDVTRETVDFGESRWKVTDLVLGHIV